MAMLTLGTTAFSTGRARFSDALSAGTGDTARVYVKVMPAGLGVPVLALLDTGAPWTVLDPSLAKFLDLGKATSPRMTLESRFGRHQGRLFPLEVTILADEGKSLEVQSTVFIPDADWPPGRNFIGYSGTLERIRIGLDPQTNDFYFGGY